MIRVNGLTHIALELSWPTRMEDYLRDAFGLQTLRHGYWKGDYIRVMGSPHLERPNKGFIWLYLRTSIPRGRLRHIGFGVEDVDIATAVADLQARDLYVDVDAGDMLYAPEGLQIKLDSYTKPRPDDPHDPNIKMEDCPIDPDLPCLVNGIHHIAVDVAIPTRMRDWMENAFGLDGRRSFHRRGEYIHGIFYNDAKRDTIGRRGSLLAIFQRPLIERVRCHHIAFDVDDSEGVMETLKERGFEVPVTDAIMYGPEEIWYQIDSRITPFPVGHPTNQPGIPLNPP